MMAPAMVNGKRDIYIGLKALMIQAGAPTVTRGAGYALVCASARVPDDAYPWVDFLFEQKESNENSNPGYVLKGSVDAWIYVKSGHRGDVFADRDEAWMALDDFTDTVRAAFRWAGQMDDFGNPGVFSQTTTARILEYNELWYYPDFDGVMGAFSFDYSIATS